MNNKRVIVATLAGLVLTTSNPASAQAPQSGIVAFDQQRSDEDSKLVRKDVRSLKKQLIAANIELTDTEAQQFWPIYDRYTSEMVRIMDTKYALLDEYARNYNTITDEQADAYIKGCAAVEESLLQLRLKYMPLFRKVLSGRTAALFIQMDWRIGLVVDLQLASQVPLIEPLSSGLTPQ